VAAAGDFRERHAKGIAVLVYTLLRVALFVGVWMILVLLTPVRGLLALGAAIVMSGAISLVLLDRPRNAVGAAAAGFFGRINARIDASSGAEDAEDDAARAATSAQAEGQSENQAVDQQ